MKRVFVQTTVYSRRLDEKGFPGIQEAVENEILKIPDAGDRMPGCGGVQKIRISDPSRKKGKRGGIRVLYLDIPHLEKTYLLYLYGKDEAEDISSEGKKRIAEIAKRLKEE